MAKSTSAPLENKPERLYFRSFVQMIRNSVGTAMFRNFYIRSPDGEIDALEEGDKSCAFYVSAVLVIWGKLRAPHGTVASTVRDLQASGWQEVDSPKVGDVIVWGAETFEDGSFEHIGFCIGHGKAVSTSRKEKMVVEHDLQFGDAKRPIKQIFRMNRWDQADTKLA